MTRHTYITEKVEKLPDGVLIIGGVKVAATNVTITTQTKEVTEGPKNNLFDPIVIVSKGSFKVP